MQTSEASKATSADARQADPRRVRISVPLADISTNAWLDAQDNISRSIQVLVRESIERDGVIDVVNRPVEQLPRRGRPPLTLVEQAEATATENHSQSLPTAQEQAQPAAPIEEALAPLEEREHQPERELEVELVEETPEPTETVAPESAAQPKAAPSAMHEFLTR